MPSYPFCTKPIFLKLPRMRWNYLNGELSVSIAIFTGALISIIIDEKTKPAVPSKAIGDTQKHKLIFRTIRLKFIK